MKLLKSIWHHCFDETNEAVLRRKNSIHEIIFEAEKTGGKLFDIALLIVILCSVLVVMLESIKEVRLLFGRLFYLLEWGFTILFTIEYLLRLYCLRRPLKYALSFFGIIDLLAVLPTYISFFATGTQSLLVIRILRLLRIFRLFKLIDYFMEGAQMVRALKASQRRIVVFLFFIILLVVIFGSLMYVIEGDQPGTTFTSIPRSIYWAIVTLTTVGYGDITPHTALGQFISALVMIMGYAVIAVPTGIVSVEMFRTQKIQKDLTTIACLSCGREGHDSDAVYCKYCGVSLEEEQDGAGHSGMAH